jgi:hypothetical protein
VAGWVEDKAVLRLNLAEVQGVAVVSCPGVSWRVSHGEARRVIPAEAVEWRLQQRPERIAIPNQHATVRLGNERVSTA